MLSKQILTKPSGPEVEQDLLGYLINVVLSKDTRAAVASIQDEFESRFPGAIWRPPAESLHITIMDWLTPLTDYGQDKDELYNKLAPVYLNTLEDVLKGQPPIDITFDQVEAFPAAVIIKGHDDGSVQRIREQFLRRVTLLPGTKIQEPSFVHSTICRFTKAVDFASVQEAAHRQTVSAQEHIDEVWLSRETKYGMRGYKVLKRFSLKR